MLLADRDNLTLGFQILQDPRHSTFLAYSNDLPQPAGSVIWLVLSFLEQPQAPSAALSVVANRSDVKFITKALRTVDRQSARHGAI